jgi:hypothetical protein
MPSQQPVTVNDLNGVEFNSGEMVIDDVVGYVGYIKSLCTDLGTEADEGYEDFKQFQEEIRSARISTFEPDAIDDKQTFETLDLSGFNNVIREYPMQVYCAMMHGKMYWSYQNGVTPYDFGDKDYIKPNNPGITPFDFDESLLTAYNNKNSSHNPDDLVII